MQTLNPKHESQKRNPKKSRLQAMLGIPNLEARMHLNGRKEVLLLDRGAGKEVLLLFGVPSGKMPGDALGKFDFVHEIFPRNVHKMHSKYVIVPRNPREMPQKMSLKIARGCPWKI